jgi:putative hydrolase of the HAD superfamily
MIDLLPLLTKRYKLILLSNTNDLHVEVIEKQYAFFQYFHHLVFSHLTGTSKPDPKIYQTALDLSNSSPETCLFIDDLEENVKVAIAMGMSGIVFSGYTDLIDKFTKYHIIY